MNRFCCLSCWAWTSRPILFTLSLAFEVCGWLKYLNRNAQVRVWLAPLPINSCIGAIANRGQWEQACRLFMATDLGPVRATRRKKRPILFNFYYFLGLLNLPNSKIPWFWGCLIDGKQLKYNVWRKFFSKKSIWWP